MPQNQGQWTFRIRSSDPQMNGQSGSFEVGRPAIGNHGPVGVVKTYHFSYADGTPYFLLGTTLYNWLNRDWALEQRTLTSLASSPFNKVRFGLFPKWLDYNHVDPPRYPYVQRAKHEFDLDRFDPKFFSHVEERLRDLQKLGIEADIILFHPYDIWGFAKMDAAHDDAYIRYVVARLAAFRNVWWTMANEYNLWDPKLANIGLADSGPLPSKDWDRMFRVLKSADPYGHLRGIHNLGTWYDHSKPWITHVIAQEDYRVGARTMQGRESYRKPVVIDELGYEGDTGQPWGTLTGQEELDRHWQVTLAGGYASHGEAYVHPDGLLWWAVGGELVGDSPARLGFLKEVMTQAPFQDLAPAPTAVMGGTALAQAGGYYLFYFRKLATEPAQIATTDSELYKVELIDPWLMKIYALGYTTGGIQAFTPVMAPCLLRLTKTPPGETPRTATISQLLAEFIGEPANPPAAKGRPFQLEKQYYSSEYTLDELLSNSRARAAIEKYTPQWVKLRSEYPLLGGLPVEMLRDFVGDEAPDTAKSRFNGLAAELLQIPTPQ